MSFHGRRRLPLILLCGAVLLLGLFLRLWQVRILEEARRRDSPAAPVSNPRAVENEQRAVITTLEAPPQSPSIRERIELLKQDPEWDSKRPIAFYGKVIDEKSEVVTGATVTFSWADSKGDGLLASAISDAQGMFSLTGVTGKRLQVRVEKAGYYASKKQNQISFEYADPGEPIFHNPDRLKPVLFSVRERGRIEPQITGTVKLPIPKDGTIVRVDLFQGKITDDGQLIIQSWKSEKDKLTGLSDWRIALSVLNGGLLTTVDEFPFEAPEGGYLETAEFSFSKNLSDAWKGRIQEELFIRLGEPKRYARIKVETSAWSEIFYLSYFVNPSGSRNLEFDATAPPKQAHLK